MRRQEAPILSDKSLDGMEREKERERERKGERTRAAVRENLEPDL